MKMDMTQYLNVFLEESREHLESLNQRLLDLEKSPNDIAILNDIFRSAHTLKGMSSTMGYDNLADLTHHMEDVLSDLKSGILDADILVVNTLFRSFDRIQLMIDKIEDDSNEIIDNSDLVEVLNNIKNRKPVALEPNTEQLDASISSFDERNDIEEIFELNEYDMTLIAEAQSKDLEVLDITVVIDENCLMKIVRAYMVIKALEEEGELIKSIPSVQDIDDGKFDDRLSLLIITKLDKEKIEQKIMKIPEVSIHCLKQLDASEITQEKKSSPAEKVEKKAAVLEDNKEIKKSAKTKQTVRVDIDRLDNLMNLVGELVMHKGRMEQIGADLRIAELNETLEQINRVSADLQSVVMKVRMVSVETVFNRFPRMVRDLAKELNKDIEFIVEGQETELDRTVIDEIGDPLVHLLRNSLDHGIETNEERVEIGKPRKGTVFLRARHEGNNVYIEVEDDGRGIVPEKVLGKAIEKGLITKSQADDMSFEEAANLLFHSGFSTAANVTDISGRGVGLDVVKTKIESLSGEINIESRPGIGSKFKIKLPLTLAIIQALMISVCDEVYAIPLSTVDETTIINIQDIKNIQNQEVIMLRGTVLPLYRLAALVEAPDTSISHNESIYVVIVRKGGRQIGLVVDTLIGQQEIVIKSLGKIFQGLPGIAGGIVDRDGHVRLILDMATLF